MSDITVQVFAEQPGNQGHYVRQGSFSYPLGKEYDVRGAAISMFGLQGCPIMLVIGDDAYMYPARDF